MGVWLDIYSETVSRITAAKVPAGRLEQLKHIYEGIDDRVTQETPYVVVYPITVDEQFVSFPKKKNSEFRVGVRCAVKQGDWDALNPVRGVIAMMEDVADVLDGTDFFGNVAQFINLGVEAFENTPDIYHGTIVITPTDRFQGGARST